VNKTQRLEQVLGFVALGLLLIGCFVVMRPFLSAAMWAVVLCFSLWPIQSRLTRWLGNRRTLAACCTTLTIALVLLAPIAVIGVSVVDDARALGTETRKWIDAGPPPPPAWLAKIPVVGKQAQAYWKEFAGDAATLLQQFKKAAEAAAPESAGAVPSEMAEGPLTAQPPADLAPATQITSESRLVAVLKRVLGWARSWLVSASLAIGRGVVEVALSVFLSFFIFRDGAAVADRLTHGIGRIAGDRGKHLLEVAGNTVRGVVYGILGTALVQGAVAYLGFLFAGVPGATLLGVLTFFLSVVPMGPPLVWIPAVIWLFQHGSTGWGIFMLVWGLGVSSIDNVVKPWLISQGSNLPFILIFFGVIGGALAFGFVGVFLGPTLLAVAYRLIEEWSTAPAPAAAADAAVNPDPPAAAEPRD
jgi:predicted PurR-regulated permease PerM